MHQPDLLPPGAASKAAAPIRGAAAPRALVRVETIVRLVVRVYLGVLVLLLPWLPLWSQNNLFTYSPVLQGMAGSGFVRGLISGLGLLNILLAVVELRRLRRPVSAR